jgi:hypothetical protein
MDLSEYFGGVFCGGVLEEGEGAEEVLASEQEVCGDGQGGMGSEVGRGWGRRFGAGHLEWFCLCLSELSSVSLKFLADRDR